jgi:hypothetical protein
LPRITQRRKPLTRARGLSRAAFRGATAPNEYLLTTKKGSTWEIKSDSVNLGEHGGHTVTITGAISNPKMHGMKEDAKEERKSTGWRRTDCYEFEDGE